MRGSIRIGTPYGIPIAIHPSWLFVFGLLAWQLAAAELSGASPGWSTITYWVAGLVTSLLAFASVLLHELGHSWVAIRNGIAIRSITLFIFGGVSRIAQEPPSPGVELRIAVAGPATSLALAFVFGQLGRLLSGVPVLSAPAAWLGGLNLTVALFNCLPGFPLDGGRVLRAALWRRMGELQRATRASALAGEGIGLSLMGLGVIAVAPRQSHMASSRPTGCRGGAGERLNAEGRGLPLVVVRPGVDDLTEASPPIGHAAGRVDVSQLGERVVCLPRARSRTVAVKDCTLRILNAMTTPWTAPVERAATPVA